MPLAEDPSLVGPLLHSALEQKGFTELTAVQRAVLDPALQGRDLRISSQTGSGKTVAIGLILRDLALLPAAAVAGVARPHALVVAPTRELAHQVERELAWLFAAGGVRLATATGGASYRDERRALGRGPAIVVATPGRLHDHLKRGGIDGTQVAAVVLDEADRMLDLGFRDDIEAIFAHVPATRITHLVSATFPPAVRAFADKVQREPRLVQGTRLGAANADIDHVLHVVDGNQRFDALVNLLLANPDDQTIVFVRTRADVGYVANELVVQGFPASGLSGEMEQEARNRTIEAFRKGALRVLIATDVAARGIDVPDVARVIHAEPPTSADGYTHRSGRTGRAGRKGTSALLLAPAAVVRATRLLRSLGVAHRFEPIPTAETIQQAADERLFGELTAQSAPDDAERWRSLASRLQQHGDLEGTLVRLLARHSGQSAQPRNIRAFAPRLDRVAQRGRGPTSPREMDAAADGGKRVRGHASAAAPRTAAGPRSFTPFRVSWGKQRGADPRRLLAMVCRRGNIAGTDVGAIRVEYSYSLIGVADEVAEAFARAVAEPDPREPGVIIRRDGHAAASGDEPDSARHGRGERRPAPGATRERRTFERDARDSGPHAAHGARGALDSAEQAPDSRHVARVRHEQPDAARPRPPARAPKWQARDGAKSRPAGGKPLKRRRG